MTAQPAAAPLTIATDFGARAAAWFDGNTPAGFHADRTDYAAPDLAACRAYEAAMHRAGLAGITWPTDYGGHGLTLREHLAMSREFGARALPESVNSIGKELCGPVIQAVGSAAQKAALLPRILDMTEIWCQGFSEPEAGSDLASLRTTAVRDGDHYVINGQKTWTTLGQYADWIFLLARTDPGAPKKQAGISFILAEMSTPGITLRPIKLIDGSYEVNEVWFEDVRVPADQLVGEENAGWSYAKFLLSNERNGIARVGTSKAWLADVKERAAKTAVGDRTLLEEPLFAARVAEIENELLALELTQLRVSGDEGTGKPNPASSILKLRGSQLQQAVTELLVEVAGSDGLPFEAPEVPDSPAWAQHAAPKYLNYRKTSIYGGSNEIQRTIISSTILGL